MNVEIEYGETANAGNFESIRVACRLEEHLQNPSNKEIESVKELLYKKAKKFVQAKIIEELKERNA